MEELALAGLLNKQAAKQVGPQHLDFFNAVEDTRMEHLLPAFLKYWAECAVPKLHERLVAHARRRARANHSDAPAALTDERLGKLLSYRTTLPGAYA